MANDCTQFSERIDLRNLDKEIKWIEDVLEVGLLDFPNEDEFKKYLEQLGIETKDLELIDSWPFFSFEFDSDSEDDTHIRLYSDDNTDLEHVRAFVAGFVKEHQPDLVFTLQWADTSDRDGCSGGAMVVSSQGSRVESTQALLLRLQDELKAAK